MSYIDATFAPFSYHQIARIIRRWRANGVRSIKIRIGEFAQRPRFNMHLVTLTYDLEQVTNVWANSRRFYAQDFMFFRWIYKMFRNAGIKNHWWEPCEVEDPIESLSPGNNYTELLPYVTLSNTNDQQESVVIWNFWDHVYMNITPKFRNRPGQNNNISTYQMFGGVGNRNFVWTDIEPTTQLPTENIDFPIEDEEIEEPIDQETLPSAEDIGLSLGYVSSHEEDGK